MKNKSLIYGAFLLAVCSIAAVSSFSLTKALVTRSTNNVSINIGSTERYISFSVEKDTGMGNSVYLVGDFCDWAASNPNAIKFSWTDGNIWVANITVQAGTVYHCKLVNALEESPNTIWEWEKDGEGNERVLAFNTSTSYNFTWGSY